MNLYTGLKTQKGQAVQMGDILKGASIHDSVVLLDRQTGQIVVEAVEEKLKFINFNLASFLSKWSDLVVAGSLLDISTINAIGKYPSQTFHFQVQLVAEKWIVAQSEESAKFLLEKQWEDSQIKQFLPRVCMCKQRFEVKDLTHTGTTYRAELCVELEIKKDADYKQEAQISMNSHMEYLKVELENELHYEKVTFEIMDKQEAVQ